MVGSACVAQFATRAELDAWLRTDPYVTGDVWQDIQVLPYRVAPHYDFPPCPEPTRAAALSTAGARSRARRRDDGPVRRPTPAPLEPRPAGWRAVNTYLLTGAALVVVIAGMRAAAGILVPFLLAVFVAVICAPLYQGMTRRRVPGSLAILGSSWSCSRPRWSWPG